MKIIDKLRTVTKKRQAPEQSNFAHDGVLVSPMSIYKKGVFEDYLFGDSNLPGMHAVLPEFTIDKRLTDFYMVLERKLDDILANGMLDACNGDMYDSRIESIGALALSNAESQYAWIIEQPLQIALSVREHDIIKLTKTEEIICKEIDELDAELAILKEKESLINSFKLKRSNKE